MFKYLLARALGRLLQILVMPTILPILVAPTTCDEIFSKYSIIAVFLPLGQPAIEAFSKLVDDVLLALQKHKAILDNQRLLLYSHNQRTLDDILDIGHVLFMSVELKRILESDNASCTTDITCASLSTNIPGPF